MNHFILTRFNLKLWWKCDKNGRQIRTEEWLEERFRLFETYCWPSVMAQTMMKFKWICLFDEDTPLKYKERVEAYHARWKGFLPFFIGRDDTLRFQQFFQKKVAELADKNDAGLLTTYLDNDDCIERDYVKTLQQCAKTASYDTVFIFKYGIQYYERLNLAVKVPYANNHFLSFYECADAGRVKTVWAFWHFSIFRYHGVNFEVANNCSKPMWIELIHEGNIDNDVKMTLCQRLIVRRDSLEHFGLSLQLRPVTESVLLFCTAFQIRFIRQIVRRLKNKTHGDK